MSDDDVREWLYVFSRWRKFAIDWWWLDMDRQSVPDSCSCKGNERRPMVVRRYDGTNSSSVDDDRRQRRPGRSDTGTSWFKYAGAIPRRTRYAISIIWYRPRPYTGTDLVALTLAYQLCNFLTPGRRSGGHWSVSGMTKSVLELWSLMTPTFDLLRIMRIINNAMDQPTKSRTLSWSVGPSLYSLLTHMTRTCTLSMVNSLSVSVGLCHSL